MRYDMYYDSPRRQSPFSLTPWVRGIIMANAAVYLLTITVFTGPWIYEFSAFNPQSLASAWWTFLTYMFVHGGFLHLLFNMLVLFFFGPAVEERMGGSSFAIYYFVCGIGGALFSLLISFFTPVAPFVGASAAVLGVALAFAMHWPDAPVYVFPLPVPIKVKWLVGFLIVVNLWAGIVGADTGIAYLAHLGGLLFGFVFLKSEAHFMQRTQGFVRSQPGPMEARAARARKSAETAGVRAGAPNESDNRRTKYDEVDRVLDKISESGLDSLSQEERALLDEASRDLRRH
jgi:membrane associated rhomboid family serine protease